MNVRQNLGVIITPALGNNPLRVALLSALSYTRGTPVSNLLLIGSGGTAPYSFTTQAGTIPPGLSYGPTTGIWSGTPTTLGQYTFVIKILDSASNFSFRSFSINIVTRLVSSSTSPPIGEVNLLYGYEFRCTGFTGAVTWSLVTGALPTGTALTNPGGTPNTGLLSGTPSAAGAYYFTVRATDSGSGDTADFPCTVLIYAALTSSTVVLNATYLTPGTIDFGPYISGGVPPYRFAGFTGGPYTQFNLTPGRGNSTVMRYNPTVNTIITNPADPSSFNTIGFDILDSLNVRRSVGIQCFCINPLGAVNVRLNGTLVPSTAPVTDINFQQVGASASYAGGVVTFVPAAGASGTVTGGSGGSTGLTLTGTVTLTLGGTLAIANGGTGATTAAAARAALGAGTGNGTVTSFAAGALAPLFTTGVLNASSSPSLSFSLTGQSAGLAFMGPTTGTAAPTWRAVTTTDLLGSAGGQAYSNVTTGAAISNTAVQTNFASTYSYPSALISAGEVIHIRAAGRYSATGAPTITFVLRLNSTNFLVFGPIAVTSGAANLGWELEAAAIIQTLGATGAIEIAGRLTLGGSATTAATVIMAVPFSGTINTTIGTAVNVSVQWGTASVSNTATLTQLIVELNNS